MVHFLLQGHRRLPIHEMYTRIEAQTPKSKPTHVVRRTSTLVLHKRNHIIAHVSHNTHRSNYTVVDSSAVRYDEALKQSSQTSW